MTPRTWIRVTAAATAALLALVSFSLAAPPEKVRNHFDSDAPMREPAFFDFAVLGPPGEAQWKVVTEFNPPSAPNGVSQVISERPSDSIAAALRRNVKFKNGAVSLGIKKAAGHGGVVLRLADEKNYLALLVDPVSGDARLLQSIAGRTSELARGHAETPRDWAVLGVTLAGPKITATWEGKALFEATTTTTAAGRAGIATAGPGIMTFDEFVIEPEN
jgi:hypothetical protein